MKKSFFIFLFLFTIFYVNSQVVINYNTHSPVIGTQNEYYEIDFIFPEKADKNSIWDFSNIQISDTIRKTGVSSVNPNDIKKFNLNANCVLYEDDFMFFHSLSKDQYAITGFINDNYIIQYDKPLIRMKYPFSFTDEFEGQLVATALNKNNSKTEITGNYFVSADAYGKIILPGNITKDVLRVYQHSTSVQVSNCREVHIESSKYIWYSAVDRYPIATTLLQKISYCNGDVKLKKKSWINKKHLKVNQEQEEINLDCAFNAEIFPNPFVDIAEVMLNLETDAEVEIFVSGVVGTKLETVQESQKLEQGQHFYKINSADLSLQPGMYFVNIRVGDKVESLKLIKK